MHDGVAIADDRAEAGVAHVSTESLWHTGTIVLAVLTIAAHSAQSFDRAVPAAAAATGLGGDTAEPSEANSERPAVAAAREYLQ